MKLFEKKALEKIIIEKNYKSITKEKKCKTNGNNFNYI